MENIILNTIKQVEVKLNTVRSNIENLPKDDFNYHKIEKLQNKEECLNNLLFDFYEYSGSKKV